MLKVNWHSPLPPAKTDIANFSMRILPLLKESLDELTLYPHKNPVDPAIRKRFQVVHKKIKTNRNAIEVYNIGNNVLFHSHIYEASIKKPGVVVLHDICLLDFFYGYFHDKKNSKGFYALIEKLYGKERCKKAKRIFSRTQKKINVYEHYPMVEAAISKAKLIIVHSEHSKRMLKRIMPKKKVVVIPLPFSTPVSPKQRPKESKRFNLVMVGHMGGNRRVLEFLKIFSKFKHKGLFKLHIYGSFYDEKLLRNTIRSLKLSKYVQYHGFSSERKVAAALDSASLGINLRYPTMHEVSASQLMFFKHAVPTITTNVGWYKSLSKNITRKISIRNEERDILKTLNQLKKNPKSFQKMGEKGQNFYLKHHLPEHYVNALVNSLQNSKLK